MNADNIGMQINIVRSGCWWGWLSCVFLIDFYWTVPICWRVCVVLVLFFLWCSFDFWWVNRVVFLWWVFFIWFILCFLFFCWFLRFVFILFRWLILSFLEFAEIHPSDWLCPRLSASSKADGNGFGRFFTYGLGIIAGFRCIAASKIRARLFFALT